MASVWLAVLALALAGPVPLGLARARWPQRVPRAAIVLWQAIAVAAVLAAVGSALAAPEGLRRALPPEAGGGPPMVVAVVAPPPPAGLIVLRLFGVPPLLAVRPR